MVPTFTEGGFNVVPLAWLAGQAGSVAFLALSRMFVTDASEVDDNVLLKPKLDQMGRSRRISELLNLFERFGLCDLEFAGMEGCPN